MSTRIPSPFLPCLPMQCSIMESTVNRRIAIRAPPPTPIAPGNGCRSAVCSFALNHYLENSLRVPDLILPYKSPAKIGLDSIITAAGDAAAAAADDSSALERVAAAAEKMGWFLICGDEVGEIGRELFEAGGEDEGLGGMRKEAYRIRIFREAVKKVACKLETVAEAIAKILSKHVGNDQNQSAEDHKVHSVICHRKNGDSDIQRDSHSLSLHVARNGYRFCLNSPDSTSFTLPTGSILVTIGKQFEELCHGVLKSYNGEVFLVPSDDQAAAFWLEFICSLTVTNSMPDHTSSKTVSIMDQLLILLILTFLYHLWS